MLIKHANQVNFYFTDLHHRAVQLPVYRRTWDNGAYVVEVSSVVPIAVNAYLAVPRFGYTWVCADNAGAGYVEGEVSLVKELASSRIARCERAAEAYGLEPKLGEARLRLNAGDFMDALASALVAGEEIELTHAREVLEARNLLDHPGPIVSAPLFGERLDRWAIGVGPDWSPEQFPNFLRPITQWSLVAELCNGTVLPNFWRWVEYEKGRYRWEPLDQIVEFAKRREMAVKSFAIYWGGIGGTPPWFRNLGFEEKLEAVEKWATDLVTRYRGKVAVWEIVNEMHDWGFTWFPTRFSHERTLELTRFVSGLVGDLDPGTARVINHCCIWGDYVQEGVRGGPWCPITYLEDVVKAGIDFEGIGLQYYNPGRDLMECIQLLDRYLSFGKDVYITEMGTPSDPRPLGADETAQVDPNVGWRGPWTQERQAEWVEYWYTLAASRRRVKLMNWWDFDDRQAFIAHAGLLDGEGCPKQAYPRLRALCRHYGFGLKEK